jgi:hypothetical protein
MWYSKSSHSVSTLLSSPKISIHIPFFTYMYPSPDILKFNVMYKDLGGGAKERIRKKMGKDRRKST